MAGEHSDGFLYLGRCAPLSLKADSPRPPAGRPGRHQRGRGLRPPKTAARGRGSGCSILGGGRVSRLFGRLHTHASFLKDLILKKLVSKVGDRRENSFKDAAS